MIKCLCINDKNRPQEILPQNWIQEGIQYHIIHIYKQMNISQKGIQGVELLEVKTKSTVYNCYKLSRFAIFLEDLPKLFQMMKDCTELNDVDINELISECELIDK